MAVNKKLWRTWQNDRVNKMSHKILEEYDHCYLYVSWKCKWDYYFNGPRSILKENCDD